MKRTVKRWTAAMSVLVLAPGAPWAAEQTVDVNGATTNATYRLPPDTREVELVRQTAGACRLGRSWGYDLASRELWANGCSGSFRITTHGSEPAAAPSSSNAGAAIAAAAAIAGIALLASRGRKHHDDSGSNQSGYVPPNPGYYPAQNNPAYYPPSAGYYPPPAGTYPAGGGRQGTIHGPGGLCLDMHGDRVAQGTEAIVYRCHGNNNQRFNWTPRGELIVANMCLDIAGGSRDNGARVIAWPCNGGRNQQWYVSGTQIRSQQNNKCLDVAGGNLAQGTPVVMYDCHGGPNQTWFW